MDGVLLPEPGGPSRESTLNCQQKETLRFAIYLPMDSGVPSLA